MSLALATIGCGKKITEGGSKPASNVQNVVLPSAYVIRLDGSESSRKQVRLPKNTQFEVPTKVKVRSGSTTNKSVEISFDVNPYDSDDFYFKCSYKSVPNETDLVLDRCVDYDGDYLGDVRGYVFTLYENDIIQSKFTGAPAQDLVTDAVFNMRWI